MWSQTEVRYGSSERFSEKNDLLVIHFLRLTYIAVLRLKNRWKKQILPGCKIVLRLVQVSIFSEGSSLVMRTGSPQQVTYFQMKRPKGNQFTSGTRSVLVLSPKDSPGYEPEIVPDG